MDNIPEIAESKISATQAYINSMCELLDSRGVSYLGFFSSEEEYIAYLSKLLLANNYVLVCGYCELSGLPSWAHNSDLKVCELCTVHTQPWFAPAGTARGIIKDKINNISLFDKKDST